VLVSLNTQQRSLCRKFILYKFLSSLFFIHVIWFHFYRRFITDQQIGILDGIAFAIGLCVEIPSGILADSYGRAKMVKLGHALAATGFAVQAFGNTFIELAIGQSVAMIGASCVSGADDALFFTKLKFESSSLHWRKLAIKSGQVVLIAQLASTIVGTILYGVDPRLPWIVSSIAFLGAAYIVWDVEEDDDQIVTQERLPFSDSLTRHLRTLRAGFIEFQSLALRRYVPIIITIEGIFYASEWGLLKLVLLDRFGFSPFWGGIVESASVVATIGLLEIIHRFNHSISQRKIIILTALMTVIALVASIASLGYWGFFVIVALGCGHLVHPYVSDAVNSACDESARATVLSVASFLRTVPYIGLAPLIGFLNNKGLLSIFLVGWSALTILALIFFLWDETSQKRRNRIFGSLTS
jgi:MFS family permease